jgi:hypothetical protein
MKLKNYLKAGLFLCCFYFLPAAGHAQHFFGIREGVSTSRVLFNPVRRDSSTFQTLNLGLVYKYYRTTWSGIELGVNYSEKGYVLDDTTRRFRVLEIPILSQFHYEVWHIRILANMGLYASWQLSAEKSFLRDEKIEKQMYDVEGRDNRFEYGMHFGGGVGYMLDPFEIQFEVGYQYGLSYLKKPRYNNERIMFTHFTQMIFSLAVLVKI